MEILIGSIVKSKAGSDKNKFFVVISIENNFLYLCNGNNRKIENPKKKKLKHITATKILIPNNLLKSNSSIKKFLNIYNKGDKNFKSR